MKAEWAFKVFDYDGDSKIRQNDIRKVLDAITGEMGGQEKDVRLEKEEVDSVVKNVLKEADLNGNKSISLTEFKQIVTRSPEFAERFRIKL